MWHAYLLRCLDGSTYTGIAIDVEARFAAHARGQGGHYTRAHPVDSIVAAVPVGTRAQATRFEREIKGWKPARKLRFFEDYAPQWQEYCGTRHSRQVGGADMVELEQALSVHAITSHSLELAETAVWKSIQARMPALAEAIRQAGLDEEQAARWVCFPLDGFRGSPARLIACGEANHVLAHVLRATHQLDR